MHQRQALRSLTREDIEQFYRGHIGPEKAGLIAVGDITMEELTAELEKVLGGWNLQGHRCARGGHPSHAAGGPDRPDPGRQAGGAAVGDFGRLAG